MCMLIIFEHFQQYYYLLPTIISHDFQKMDLSIYSTKLGFQKYFIYVQFDSIDLENTTIDLENKNVITVTMNVITCSLQISRITNDNIPYFGTLALNKLFHCAK